MPVQKTPHTESQQNADPKQPDLEPGQLAADSGQDEDASLYENNEGAQSGGTRAFNANAGRAAHHNTEPQTSALDGGERTRTPESQEQGITNHSASEESARNRKVDSERRDATSGVDQLGHQA